MSIKRYKKHSKIKFFTPSQLLKLLNRQKQSDFFPTRLSIKFFTEKMGNADTKLNFRKAIVQLANKNQVSYNSHKVSRSFNRKHRKSIDIARQLVKWKSEN